MRLLFYSLLLIISSASLPKAQVVPEKKLEIIFLDTMRGTPIPKLAVDIVYTCPQGKRKKRKEYRERLLIIDGKLSKTFKNECTGYMTVGWDT